MKQLIQSYRTGEMKLCKVPKPLCKDAGILIRTEASVVSVGTEKMMVDLAKKSLIGKAKARPDLAKQVIEKMKQEGIFQTVQKVFNKLDNPVPLGYSCAGRVIEVGSKVTEFKVGDRVACGGGGYANHAEMNYVSRNLAAKIPSDVSFEEAAFVTLGTIALQGVRQADVRLGERVGVLGLGLIGLLTVQILKAAGCRVIGSDIDPDKLKIAEDLGIDLAVLSERYVSACQNFTGGHGLDSLIITASTQSNEPIEMAPEVCRHKGKVVALGMIRMDVPRNKYYEKELDLRLSMAYGPGRYDPEYEEKGIDYPYPFVRWTEQRNMQAFLELLSQGKVEVKSLITHKFPIDHAKEAYDLILGKTKERFLAVLFEYPEVKEEKVERRIFLASKKAVPKKTINIGLIGAGDFSKGVLLPGLKKVKRVNFRALVTATGISARHTGEKFGFDYITTDYREILHDGSVDAVLIATRHNLHAKLVIEALEKDKHVFVEKPLALSEEELFQVVEARQKGSRQVMVGFNRRFSPLVREVKGFFGTRGAPLAITYRINAGPVPGESWIQDPEEGGGRIIGEVCHFVDLIQYLISSEPQVVYAQNISGDGRKFFNNDTLNVTLKFGDGSIGAINYFSIGNKSFPKERVEVFGENSVAVIDDFRRGILVREGKERKLRRIGQDKGHTGELKAFVEAIKKGKEVPISFKESSIVTMVTFKIVESLKTGMPVKIPSFE